MPALIFPAAPSHISTRHASTHPACHVVPCRAKPCHAPPRLPCQSLTVPAMPSLAEPATINHASTKLNRPCHACQSLPCLAEPCPALPCLPSHKRPSLADNRYPSLWLIRNSSKATNTLDSSCRSAYLRLNDRASLTAFPRISARVAGSANASRVSV